MAAADWISLLSTIYGASKAKDQQKLGRTAIAASDPFGPYRAGAAKQLMALLADPSLITKEPGYEFEKNQGLDAVQNRLRSQGYGRSGNEAIALDQYATDYASNALDKKLQFLAGLAGAGITPNPGPGLNEVNAGIETANSTLAGLGYIAQSGSLDSMVDDIEKLFGKQVGLKPSSGVGPNTAGGVAAGAGSSTSGAVTHGYDMEGSSAKIGMPDGYDFLGGTADIASGLTKLDYTSAISSYGDELGSNLDKLIGGTSASGAGVSTGVSGWSNGGSAVTTAMGIWDAWNSLTKEEGKFGGTISGAKAGYEIGGPWGALVGAAIGYTVEGGYKDAAPYDAAGFSGTTMDQAWRDQNVLRLASNPAASIASKLGVKSNSVLGKILDPAAVFQRHGDEKRNFNAFSDAFPGIKDLGKGMWELPDGKQVTGDQIQWLAGTWYGAQFHPDGDQEGWQQKFNQAVKDIYGTDASFLGQMTDIGGETPGQDKRPIMSGLDQLDELRNIGIQPILGTSY